MAYEVKWELHTLECTEGFQSVLSEPCAGLADALLVDGMLGEFVDDVVGVGEEDLTAILHLRATSG